MRAKLLLLVSVTFATACKPPAPAEQLHSALSWIGTAEMAGAAWVRHTTPDTYTRQTLELSHETLAQISNDLLKSPPTNADTAALNSVLTRSRGRIARMAGLIAAKNAPDFARELDSLRVDHKIAKQSFNSVESKQ